VHTQSSLMKAAERPRRQTGATSSDPASNVAANEETPSSEVCGMGGWVGGWEEPLGVCVGGWVVGGGGGGARAGGRARRGVFFGGGGGGGGGGGPEWVFKQRFQESVG
jgi:hypothetical protein